MKEYLGKKITVEDELHLPRNVRVITIGSCITCEYNMGRINLHLDENRVVEKVSQG